MPDLLTQDAKHGTKYRYAIEYKAAPDSPRYIWKCWAYNLDDALEQFHESEEDYEPTRYARLTDGLAKDQDWYEV